ncbi:ABC transporter substrate-binding protein [candidate division WOR-3 bacterium]|nr:ABC transporter substrate-binding protein [candidate division WOR-3 bacterium]
MKNIARLFLCALALSASFCSRNTPRNTPRNTRNTPYKSNGEPHRVISLVPSLTEITYALGAEDRLVGVTTYCDYPPEVKEKKKVGDFLSPDPERLRLLKPDLILLATPTQAQLARDLKAAGFRVAVFTDPRNLEGVFAQIQALADTLGVSDRGEELVDSLKSELKGIEKDKELSIYIEISEEPLISVGGGSYLTDAFEHIGLVNVFSDLSQGYPVIDPEEVVVRSPEIILLLYPNADRRNVQKRIGWSGIPAISRSVVFDSLPVDELMRPGPRLIRGLQITDSIVRHAF